jgi:hypothetical protein
VPAGFCTRVVGSQLNSPIYAPRAWCFGVASRHRRKEVSSLGQGASSLGGSRRQRAKAHRDGAHGESVIISTRPSRLFRGRPSTCVGASERVGSMLGETSLAVATDAALAGGVDEWARTIVRFRTLARVVTLPWAQRGERPRGAAGRRRGATTIAAAAPCPSVRARSRPDGLGNRAGRYRASSSCESAWCA